MKLTIKKATLDGHYVCELTEMLDDLAGISKRDTYDIYFHYILIDTCFKKDNCFPIRVPGGTVGGIWVDDNNIITKIVIDRDYVVKSYPEDVEQQVQKYLGEVIEFN